MTSTVTTILTHSGSFHGDDLFAYAVLRRLFPEAALLRTRDEKIIAAAGDETLVFDIGGAFDPARGRFDHHQPDKPRRGDGLPYSSFGLVWASYGRARIAAELGGDLSPEEIEDIHSAIDGGLVRDIDAVDNGAPMPDQDGVMHPLTLPWLLMDFRPDFDDDTPGAMDAAFVEAAAVAEAFLGKRIRRAASELRAEDAVATAIAQRTDPRWVELPRGMPWHGPLLDSGADEILFVVNPAPGEWQLNVVNIAEHSFIARKSLPEDWAGLRGSRMETASGVEGAVFCHSGRFIATADSRDAVLALLEKALAD